MVPPPTDEWWKIDEPDEPEAPPEPVTLANAVGTLYNSEWPFEVLQVPRPESPMSFQDAILNSLMNFKDFSGRATRSEFWWFQLFFVANVALFGAIFQEVFADGYGDLASLLFSALCWSQAWLSLSGGFTISVTPDGSPSSFHPYLNLWFVFVLMAFLAYEGEDKPNKYGEVPTNVRIMALPKTD